MVRNIRLLIELRLGRVSYRIFFAGGGKNVVCGVMPPRGVWAPKMF